MKGGGSLVKLKYCDCPEVKNKTTIFTIDEKSGTAFTAHSDNAFVAILKKRLPTERSQSNEFYIFHFKTPSYAKKSEFEVGKKIALQATDNREPNHDYLVVAEFTQESPGGMGLQLSKLRVTPK